MSLCYLLLAFPSSSIAARRHTVMGTCTLDPAVTCNNLSSHGSRCGTWITNERCGYYLGRAYDGWTFDNHETSSDGHHFGRVFGTVNMCGWIEPGVLSTDYTTVADSCSSATYLSNRDTFGKDFNCGVGEAGDGTRVDLAPGCDRSFYDNYFFGSVKARRFGPGV